MARVIIEDRTGSRLDIELTKGRDEYGPSGPHAEEEWHVVAFADGRVYEPASNLHPENAMLGEFATHNIAENPTRPHVESGLCSCRPTFVADRSGGHWVHANKRLTEAQAEAAAAETASPVTVGPANTAGSGSVSPQDGSGSSDADGAGTDAENA